MRKFKLIKKYPFLPKSWDIGFEIVNKNSCNDNTYHYAPIEEYLSPCDLKFYESALSCSIIENNPDFWEEIKEETFEILSYKYNDNIYLYKHTTINGRCYFYGNGEIRKTTMHQLSLTPTINSIKRLSDNKIFSIGDKVNNPLLITPQPFTITEFCFDCNNEHILALGGNGGINITKIEHYRTPLFTTFDNAEILEGNDVWYVSIISWTLNKTIARKEITPIPSYFKYFSSLGLAQNYLEENKPLYSKKDLFNVAYYAGIGNSNMIHRGVENWIKNNKK